MIRKFICQHFTGHLYKGLSDLNHNNTGVYLINWCVICNEYQIKVTTVKETFDSLYGYEIEQMKEQIQRLKK